MQSSFHTKQHVQRSRFTVKPTIPITRDRCIPEVNPPIDPGELSINTPFFVWMIMTPIFLFFDWFIGSTVADTEKAIERGLFYGLFYSDFNVQLNGILKKDIYIT